MTYRVLCFVLSTSLFTVVVLITFPDGFLVGPLYRLEGPLPMHWSFGAANCRLLSIFPGFSVQGHLLSVWGPAPAPGRGWGPHRHSGPAAGGWGQYGGGGLAGPQTTDVCRGARPGGRSQGPGQGPGARDRRGCCCCCCCSCYTAPQATSTRSWSPYSHTPPL